MATIDATNADYLLMDRFFRKLRGKPVKVNDNETARLVELGWVQQRPHGRLDISISGQNALKKVADQRMEEDLTKRKKDFVKELRDRLGTEITAEPGASHAHCSVKLHGVTVYFDLVDEWSGGSSYNMHRTGKFRFRSRSRVTQNTTSYPSLKSTGMPDAIKAAAHLDQEARWTVERNKRQAAHEKGIEHAEKGIEMLRKQFTEKQLSEMILDPSGDGTITLKAARLSMYEIGAMLDALFAHREKK